MNIWSELILEESNLYVMQWYETMILKLYVMSYDELAACNCSCERLIQLQRDF